MGLRDVTDRDAILSALQEYDRLGRDEFLRKYGYGRAKRYFVEHEGRLYDSKAIVGVAHGYQFPEQGPLTNDLFSGGEIMTKRHLEGVGFRIVTTDTETNAESEALPIGELIEQILALQTTWSKDNTPDMQMRGE